MMDTMTIGAPQLIMIGLLMLSLGVNLAKHGEPRTPTNVWHSAVSLGITLPLLWWGGFFGH